MREQRASSLSGTVGRDRDGRQGPRSPATGKGRLVITAGAAGLAVLREGWKPVRGETRQRLDAQHDGPASRAGTRPGPPTLRSTLSGTEGTTSAGGSASGLNVMA